MAVFNVTTKRGILIELTIDDINLSIDNTFFAISEDLVREIDYLNNI
jgi:hypothetical protein|tara:strand:+ start:96250 stop:96390 length:141 start_codon:yes stop_codon:yes gene_type:complete